VPGRNGPFSKKIDSKLLIYHCKIIKLIEGMELA
jgi:hypothetical protein